MEMNKICDNIVNTFKISIIISLLFLGLFVKMNEFKEITHFISNIMNNNSMHQSKRFLKSNKPKISVIIATYNAEPYINNALLSIQNQIFKNIEIIIVDDYSKDNTLNVVRKIMKKDLRITLYLNDQNKGTLYSKAKGILKSKGKYIMILDQDDIFAHKNVFKDLYIEIEKNKLDMLGFSFIITSSNNFTKIRRIWNYYNSPVYYQPNISQIMFTFSNQQVIKLNNTFVIWKYIYNNHLIKKVIKRIDYKIMNTRMNRHEDLLIFFLLTRNAHTLKYMKNICYDYIIWNAKNKSLIKFSIDEKYKDFENHSCLSFLNYIEFLLINTENNIHDKKIGCFELENYFLRHKCRYNKYIKSKTKELIKLFINNKYIEYKFKKRLKLYHDSYL